MTIQLAWQEAKGQVVKGTGLNPAHIHKLISIQPVLGRRSKPGRFEGHTLLRQCTDWQAVKTSAPVIHTMSARSPQEEHHISAQRPEYGSAMPFARAATQPLSMFRPCSHPTRTEAKTKPSTIQTIGNNAQVHGTSSSAADAIRAGVGHPTIVMAALLLHQIY